VANLIGLNGIDPRWPAGTVEAFLRLYHAEVYGICVNILSMAATAHTWEKLARGRVYYVDDFRVLGDALIYYPARFFGLHRNVLILIRLAWCLQADHIDPRRIIWGPRLGPDPELEKKAPQFWLRPLQMHELRGAPAAIWALARRSRSVCKGSPTGLWCLDEKHVPMLRQLVGKLRFLHVLPYRFNDSYALNVKVKFSDKAIGCIEEAAE
jgi:hypothetical protein